MNKVIPRLFTFIVGVPLFVGLVFFDFKHHLPLHVMIALVSALAANEMHGIFSTKFSTQPKSLVVSMSLLTALAASVCAVFSLNEISPAFESLMNYTFMGAIMACLAFEVFAPKSFEGSNARLATSAFTILYCGFFLAFIARMTMGEHSTLVLATFLAMVFFCDSAAWLFGNLFGKGNKGFVRASPNKSIAGFCGGFAGSVLIGILAHFAAIHLFVDGRFFETFGTDSGEFLVKSVVLGIFTAAGAIVGDLVESVFKRSSGVKDSGHLIPGRGGMLDSLDSIVFAAPVYYLAYTILF